MSNSSVNYSAAKYKGGWKPNTYYNRYDIVVMNDTLWVANNDLTSGLVFDEFNWTCQLISDGFDYSWNTNTITSPGSCDIIEGNIIDIPSGVNTMLYGENSHTTGYYYLEFKMIKNLGINCYFGVSWENGLVASLNNTLTVEHRTTNVYLDGVNQSVPTNYSNLRVGDILRIWVRNGKLWLGARVNNVESVMGDPLNDTGELITFSPTNPIRAFSSSLGESTSEYSGKSYNINCDPLGATPFED